MKRIRFDVPKWHLFLHRDARGLPRASQYDSPIKMIEDELFDRLYSGELDPLPASSQDDQFRSQAEAIHQACENLPAFGRLASECRGDPMAAATAVETLMKEVGAGPLAEQQGSTSTSPKVNPIRRRLVRACEAAFVSIDKLRELLLGIEGIVFGGQLPGTGTGLGGPLPAGAIRDLSNRLRHDARLRQILMLAGRFKRIAAAKRRQKIRHGADEIADVEQGAEIGRLLPSELVKLRHPKLRLLFMKNLIEGQAMQYQLIGNAPLGKGPIIVALDKSGSMNGPPDIWATALALALMAEARRERRVFALLAFDHRVKHEAIVRADEPLPEAALFTSCDGGTNISGAIARGLEIVKRNEGQMKKADIVLVTDGCSSTEMAPKLREDAVSLGVTILGLGIGPGVDRVELEPWCDAVATVNDLNQLEGSISSLVFAG